MEATAIIPALLERYAQSRQVGKDFAVPRATSDTGNAERLFDAFEGELLFDCTRRMWRAWDGVRWTLDETGIARQLARSVVRGIPAEAQQRENGDERNRLLKWAIRSDDTHRIDAMLKEAATLPGFAVTGDVFDRDPWLLNVANGRLDLRTGELRPHDPADRLTRLSPVPFDAAAGCPTFLRALGEMMLGDDSLVGFLQRFLGYALTGVTREQVFAILHGTGANGKSTLLNAVARVFGDHATVANVSTFVTRQRPSIPNDLAALSRVRFLRCAESEQGAPLAESLVKQITGGEPISARFLHGEFFSFEPEFKLILSTNHRPRIQGTDRAIWRRVLLVPFNACFAGDRADPRLPEKLAEEAPGILAWLVRGCAEWQRAGLQVPDAVRAATKGYQTEEDTLGTFLADRCLCTEGALARAGDLFKAYVDWAQSNGERPTTTRGFASLLRERGLEPVRTNAGVVYRGIELTGGV